MNVSGKNVLIAPLDWGLGHTTRCIPIIRSLQQLQANVVVAVTPLQQKLLEQEINNVSFIPFKGYGISYPEKGNMALSMLLQSPKILHRIHREHIEIEKLIRRLNIHLVISDNRFGAFSKQIPSVYITHQINIQAPFFLQKSLYKLHRNKINRFNQCWIPDTSDLEVALAGQLSHGNTTRNDFYIGSLSRFDSVSLSSTIEYEYLAVLSGPEPQRSVLERLIIDFFKSKPHTKCAIIGGKPLNKTVKQIGNIDFFSHLNSSDFIKLVSISDKIISRPGYSSIMDWALLQKKVFFIPTPGQTEQEYLARYHYQKNGVGFSHQNKLVIDDNLFKQLPYFQNTELTQRLKILLEAI